MFRFLRFYSFLQILILQFLFLWNHLCLVLPSVLVPIEIVFRINKEKKTNQKISKGYEEAVPKQGNYNSSQICGEIHNIVSYQELQIKTKIK